MQEGEQLLWQGRPHVARFVGRKLLRDIVLGIPVILFAMWVNSFRYPSITMSSTSSWIIALICCGGGIAYLVQETRLQAQWTQYAVSSKRVFFRQPVLLPTQESEIRVQEFTLVRLRPHLASRRGDFGTITFGFPRWRYDLAFRELSDPDAVFHILTQMKPQTEAVPYYIPQTKIKSSAQPFVVDEHLRRGEQVLWRGEQVLWQGQPDVKAYVRREMRFALPCFVLVLSFLVGFWLATLATFTWPVFAEIVIFCFLVSVCVLRWGLVEEAQSFHYVATNQRALLMKSRAGKIASWDGYELAQAHQMRLVRQRDGTGSILFVKRSRIVSGGVGLTVGTYEISFKCIREAEAVHEQVRRARNRLLMPFLEEPP